MLGQLLFVCGNLYPYQVGGAEIFNYYLINSLANQKNVSFISSFPQPQNYKARYIRIPPFKPLAIFFPLFVFLHLLFLQNKDSFVVLTFSRSHWINWWPFPLLKKIKKLNYLIIIHGGRLTPWKFKQPFMKLFKNAHTIVGISERICNEYNNRTGCEVKFIPPLIPFELYSGTKEQARKKWNIANEKKMFLITGSLKPLKNPDTIIDAVVECRKNKFDENLLFVFAGDGSLKTQLQLKVKNEGLRASFLFLGNVSRENISTLYAAADYYICASDFEGTPLSLLEAMYNSLLVIGSDSPGINNIINHTVNGYLFPNKNHSKLAEIIAAISEKDNQEIRNAAFEFYNTQFSYHSMLKKYHDIFSK
ncbi:MAG: Glycosyltransferase Gtf1 [Bacteroidia bacterium]|nr:Glycosyltransferase Gtf1 [Bacteroidia bacterium]